MKSTEEFVVGKHGIGWVDSDFKKRFPDVEFPARHMPTFQMPTFQKLGKRMNDAAIESELKPGLCELGDVIAFMDNAQEECKDDGWANLFYTSDFVVHVYWDVGYGGWYVGAWQRDDIDWCVGRRVFSPATDSIPLVPVVLEHSGILTLVSEIEERLVQIKKLLS